MESHLSYPVLAYFRSQHDNQSWLAALTAILDTCAVVMVAGPVSCQRQARLTFAIARHAVVDLAQVFGTAPRQPESERLAADDWAVLGQVAGLSPSDAREHTFHELSRLHGIYEPYVTTLAAHLRLSLPPLVPHSHRADNWQTSAWGRSATPSVAAVTGDDPHD